MAKIIKNMEQEVALKSVSQYLKELKKIKEFENVTKIDYKLRIVAKSDANEVVQLSYDIDESIATTAINDYRKSIVKKITKLANDYRIGLETEEKSLLEN